MQAGLFKRYAYIPKFLYFHGKWQWIWREQYYVEYVQATSNGRMIQNTIAYSTDEALMQVIKGKAHIAEPESWAWRTFYFCTSIFFVTLVAVLITAVI